MRFYIDITPETHKELRRRAFEEDTTLKAITEAVLVRGIGLGSEPRVVKTPAELAEALKDREAELPDVSQVWDQLEDPARWDISPDHDPLGIIEAEAGRPLVSPAVHAGIQEAVKKMEAPSPTFTDLLSGQPRTVSGLPPGVVKGSEFRPVPKPSSKARKPRGVR